MNEISPLGWLGIFILVLVTAGVNVLMVSLLRSRDKMDELGRKMRYHRPPPAVRVIQQMGETARDPFKADREQMSELSRLVSSLPHEQDSNGEGQEKRDAQEKPRSE